ncbi:MAG: DNA polymerase III subunit gamma/tau [Candidatus Firestonebacteria bacterium]|nr:DNA polymerase III subunit gamma/tau [Candidatus Firestonebacteria bacterium]
MSYMVIARRWRPLNFDDIIGQEHVTRTLKNAIKQNRIAHAYLFSGPRGIGKTSTARVLAKALNCEKGPQENPCQECVSCKEITEGYSLDVIEIDGASNTSVEDVRTLRENVKFMPTHGRYKVYLIDEVHMLSKSAFNALLKTLEEPPDHVIFIFATTEKHKIPLTVISRCQQFEFRKISYTAILNTLKKIIESEHISFEDKALSILARNADGSLRDAETLLDQILASCGENITEKDVENILGLNRQETFFKFIDCIEKNDSTGLLYVIDEIIKYGYDPEQFLKGLIEHCRNLLVTKISNNPGNILELTDMEVTALAKQAEKFSKEELLTITHIISSYESKLHIHSQTRYQLEFMCMKILTFGKTLDLSKIAEKIISLEEKIKNGKDIIDISIEKKNKIDCKTKNNEDIKQEIINTEQISKNIEINNSVEENKKDYPTDKYSIIKALQEELTIKKKITLSTCISAVKDIELSDNFCIFTLDKGAAFHHDYIETPENKALVEKILLEKTGKKVKIKMVFNELSNDSEDLNIQDTDKSIQSETSTHERFIIKRALDIFEGKVIKS